MLFGAFSGLLACAILAHQLWWGGFAVWSPHGALALAALWCLARPRSIARFVTLAAVSVAVLALDMPQIGDHWVLMLVTGAGTLGWALTRVARRRAVDAAGLWAALAPFLRAQVVLLYGTAALAKLNSGFLDPAVSCAAGMSRQLGWLDPGGGPVIYATLATEASLAVLLALRRTRPAGLALGIAFHAVLAAAGNVPFSALMLALYVAFLPPDAPARLRALLSRRSAVGAVAGWRHPLAFPLAAGGWLAAAAAGIGPGAYGGALGIAGRILVAGALLAAGALLLGALTAGWPARRPRSPRLHPAFAAGLALLALNAASPYVGLKTEASFAMFSNLQTEPGHWNHLLVPESVRVFGAQDDLVRVVRSPDPRLERRERVGALMVRFELERYLRRNPRSSAWVLPATAPAGADPGEPLSAGTLPDAPVMDHLANFYDVHPGAAGRC